MAWNPVADLTPGEPVPLDCSRDAAGEPAAWVTYRRWTARERLAYEDRLLTELTATDAEGNGTVRLGQLRAVHLSLTVFSWSGFPDTLTLPDGRVEPLNLRRVEHLQVLDATVVDELCRHAVAVQPIPGTERAPAAGEDEDEGDGSAPEVADDDDPSPAPRTRPARKRQTTTLVVPPTG